MQQEHNDYSPLFHLGQDQKYDNDIDSDDLIEDLDLHEVPLNGTEMSTLRRSSSNAAGMAKRSLHYDEEAIVPLCPLLPFGSAETSSDTTLLYTTMSPRSSSPSSSSPLASHSFWFSRGGGGGGSFMAKSAVLGLAVCLVVAIVLLGGLSSSFPATGDDSMVTMRKKVSIANGSQARALLSQHHGLRDSFRVTFPSRISSLPEGNVSMRLRALFEDLD